MIFFADNVVTVVEDSSAADSSAPEDIEAADSSAPEDIEAADSSASEDIEVVDSSVPEDLESIDSSVFDESSATGETQQSSTPTIVNDIVIPDNSYSKYCFFFLMLLFALFVGRSFRKGV